MNSRDQLRQSIIQAQPPHFYAGTLTWPTIALELSQFAEDQGAFARGRPFNVEGCAAYGLTTIFRTPEEWLSGYWVPNPPRELEPAPCVVCQEEFTFDENHRNEVIEIPCQHVYYKRCINLPWIWLNSVYDVNLTGFQAKCPLCIHENIG